MPIRWQDWLSALLGCWLLVSPWQLNFMLNLKAMENAYALGMGLIIYNLISVCRKEDVGNEIVNILMGIWLMLSPFTLNYFTEKNIMLNAILVGAIVIILAVWQMLDTIKSKKEGRG